MALITLTEAKNHLRVSGSDEDTLIQLYVDAAEDYIGNYLNRSNPPSTPAVKAAALLVVGDLYENRQAQFVGTSRSDSIVQNPAVFNLLYPYRVDIGV